jgi:hypothetical protein
MHWREAVGCVINLQTSENCRPGGVFQPDETTKNKGGVAINAYSHRD